ncbi:SpoIIE family protein phosphatase [Nocardioides sp.]|uniref:SpoIIE family protein phosphatase n=1 Tax=Nocardioides sp. TaxID=35761 RepID=UPI003519319C
MPATPTDVHLPDALPVLPGLVLSARYALTGTAPLNRGDTLDAVALPEGRVGLVVGDVVGAGFAAAIAATQLRTVARERLMAGADAATAVRALHRFADHVPDLRGATVAVVVLDAGQGWLEAVTAGHPAPVLCDDTRPPRRVVAPASGPGGRGRGRPLGAGGAVRAIRLPLTPSTSVLLHTDGLTRAHGVTPAIERLLGRPDERSGDLSSAHDRADRGCERLLAAAPGDDDAVVLLARRVAPPPELAIEVPAITGGPRALVARLGSWLDAVGAGLGDRIALAHAVRELADNVVVHAYRGAGLQARPRTLRLHAVLEDDGRVRLQVTDRGRWRAPGQCDPDRLAETGAGRGLVMAVGLVDDLRVRRSGAGTEVELLHRLCRPVSLYSSAELDPDPDRASADPSAPPAELDTRVSSGQLAVSGPVDDATVDDLRTALVRATSAGTSDAVVDLSGLTALGSPGVQALLVAERRCRRSGSRLRVVAAPGCPAARVLDILDLPAGLRL